MNFANPITALLALVHARVASPPIASTDAPSPRDRLRIPIRKPVVPANGFADPRHRAGTKRITVTLDDATFADVKACAEQEHVSFAEAARRLIERGRSQRKDLNQGD